MEGYYITMDNDTVHGKIKVRIDYLDELFYVRIQYGAYYEDSLGLLTRLDPEEIKLFRFFHKYQYFTFSSQQYFNNYRLFLHEINNDGALKLFVHYRDVIDTRTNYGTLAFYLLDLPASSERDAFYILKPDGTSIKYNKYSGRKNIAEFFSDYPELQKKIERGLYGYTAVYKMVREYNSWYREKHAINN